MGNKEFEKLAKELLINDEKCTQEFRPVQDQGPVIATGSATWVSGAQTVSKLSLLFQCNSSEMHQKYNSQHKNSSPSGTVSLAI